ncbi:HIT family protein [Allonocardiopsis opalescens]|uniref:Histidine triad (HIT) family protein n=1 Tax=Allonocardiopsis opalescens TaxID=1144618 RepID=A0A2T0PST3_9ACTN|nr:HIT domain-containing protein [Allonocardiopsis opalescens]PRX91961.1 histidine triad (HIT) family protein [Allonocardiopsis opalescens]
MFARADCVFCAIEAGDAPAKIVARWLDAIAFTPLNPVTPGHTLVIPRVHVPDAVTDPAVTAATMHRAAGFAHEAFDHCNLITSVGEPATQTVFHLHIHVVPRTAGDGLLLPWTPQHAARYLTQD